MVGPKHPQVEHVLSNFIVEEVDEAMNVIEPVCHPILL
jgi:hypothetical protein